MVIADSFLFLLAVSALVSAMLVIGFMDVLTRYVFRWVDKWRAGR